jgi:hypothetical protein
MSEFAPQGEYESKGIEAVRHYYADIDRRVDDASKAMMAFSGLMDNMPFDLPGTIDDIWRVPAFKIDKNVDESATKLWRPFNEEFDLSPRIAKEKLALLPLDYFGKSLEESDCPAEYVKDWYTEAVKGILTITGSDHNMTCTRNKAKHDYLVCDRSAVCPQRYLEQYLIGDSMLPDFKRPIYPRHPWRARQITVDKLRIGTDHEILLPLDASTLESRYDLQFNGWLRSHLRYQTFTDPA